MYLASVSEIAALTKKNVKRIFGVRADTGAITYYDIYYYKTLSKRFY